MIVLDDNSIDVVIDLVAGPRWPKLQNVLRFGGRYTVSDAIGSPHERILDAQKAFQSKNHIGKTVLTLG